LVAYHQIFVKFILPGIFDFSNLTGALSLNVFPERVRVLKSVLAVLILVVLSMLILLPEQGMSVFPVIINSTVNDAGILHISVFPVMFDQT